MNEEEKKKIDEILGRGKQSKVNEIVEKEKQRENEEKKKINEIMDTAGQGAINKTVKQEKNRISKLKKDVNNNKGIQIKKYLIDSPNPSQKNIDEIVNKAKEDEKER